MNSRHVYIGNHYSFPTSSSKYRASAVGGFFDVFHEIFSKYREGNQYRVTATSALRWSLMLIKKKKVVLDEAVVPRGNIYIYIYIYIYFILQKKTQRNENGYWVL
jgi:hypothetical protein